MEDRKNGFSTYEEARHWVGHWYLQSHLILAMRSVSSPHFTDEKMEAQRGKVLGPQTLNALIGI